MFVCNCNGITEKQVKEAAQNGAQNWREVHTFNGYSPCCEKCEHDMTEALCRFKEDTKEIIKTLPIHQAS